MRIKSFVRRRDQSTIEPIRGNTGLACTYQQDGLSAGIECKGDAPLAVADTEPQFLHVAVPRRLQRIGVRARQGWTKKLKRRDRSCGRLLNIVASGSKLIGEVVVELGDPGHISSIAYRLY
jgi:hypothetical protein